MQPCQLKRTIDREPRTLTFKEKVEKPRKDNQMELYRDFADFGLDYILI